MDTQEVAAVETIQSSCSSEGGSWYLKLPGITFLGLPRCLEDLAITLRSGWPASFLSPPPTPLSMLCSYWISSYPWNIMYRYDPAQAFLKMRPELYLLVKNANSRSLCLTNRTRIWKAQQFAFLEAPPSDVSEDERFKNHSLCSCCAPFLERSPCICSLMSLCFSYHMKTFKCYLRCHLVHEIFLVLSRHPSDPHLCSPFLSLHFLLLFSHLPLSFSISLFFLEKKCSGTWWVWGLLHSLKRRFLF